MLAQIFRQGAAMIPIAQPPAIHFTVPANVSAEQEAAAVDLDRIIAVLCCLENGQWTNPGGRLCWTKQAWAEETALPYLLSQRREQAIQMAKQRLERQRALFVKLGVAWTAAAAFGCWRHGCAGSMRRVKIGHWSDYMRRGVALYGDESFQ